MADFIPVILGTDINAYGTARSLHEAYGVTSYLFGAKALKFTQNSSICQVTITPGFDQPAVFFEALIEEVKPLRMTGKKLVLISCSDGYTALVTQNKAALEEVFVFNTIDAEQQKTLENKKDFYRICDTYGLDYPETVICDAENYRDISLPFGFPVAVKPNDSIAFLNLHFPGKKKAYTAQTEAQMQEILETVYQNGYTGEMIIQDFIPGDYRDMAVLNAYVDRSGEMTMACLGKCILDECLPESIGNYNALLTVDGGALYKQYADFLKAIDYRGFANFDLKWDKRDGRYKVFEINIRQGRSSYYMTAGGCNFTRFLIEDVVYDNKMAPVHFAGAEKLWLYADPSVVKKYAAPEDLDLIAPYLKKRKYTFTQWYEKDRNLRRFLFYWRRRLATIRYYPRFEKERQETGN